MSVQSPPQSLALLNKQIRDCLNQLNAVVYLEVELELEDARLSELTDLYNSLDLVRQDARQELCRQLDSFNEQFGSSPRQFFACMYDKLNAQMPSTDPELWTVLPPFTPLNTSIAHVRMSRWNRFVTLGCCAMRVCTSRYYYAPRLSRTRASKDLKLLQEKLMVKQGLEQKLQQKLHQYKLRRGKLQDAILKVRHELANPSELYETVDEYHKYSQAARKCFSSLRLSQDEKTLPPIKSYPNKPAPAPRRNLAVLPPPPARSIPCCVFKSFEEHHGTCLDSGSWELRSDYEHIDTIQPGITS